MATADKAADKPVFLQKDSDLPRGAMKIDALQSGLRELYFVEHPARAGEPHAERDIAAFISERQKGACWVYFPWKHAAVRIPDEGTYYRLRTARNRDLITEGEQKAYRAVAAGIAGLSVGSRVLATLVASGGPKRIRLADPDTIEITNLNRIEASLADVGAKKTTVAMHAVWELDPFAELDAWDMGVSPERMGQFVSDLDVVIDEMDDIATKFALRETCKVAEVPVVMATDNGDGAILDVERFDLEPSRPIFHGRVRGPGGPIDRSDKRRFVELSNSIIDSAYFTPRQLRSVGMVGTSLSGIPQLATAAMISGAVAAFAVRHIATGAPLPSGRYRISCEAMLEAPAL